MPVSQIEVSPGVYVNVKASLDGNELINNQITTAGMAARGLYAQITGYGTARVSGEPGSLLNETFEATLDTNKWLATGTVPPTSGGGVLVLGGGTTANATSILTSVPSFYPTAGFLVTGATVKFGAAKVANCNQNLTYGFALAAAPTSVAPVDNGYVWEIDITGELSCCVFVAGVRYVINSTSAALITPSATIQAAFPNATSTTLSLTGAPITFPTGNHTLLVAQRGDLCFWYLDSFDVPVAFTKYIAPAVQSLPERIAKINAAAAVVAITNDFSATLIADSASQNTQVSDPTYPFRRMNVSATGAAQMEINNSYAHIATATTTVVKSGAGSLHSIIVNTKGTVASTITAYDNTAGSGTVIAVIDSLTLSGLFTYDIAFTTGLTLVTTGTVAPDITVSYR